jgi:hypothetical protein
MSPHQGRVQSTSRAFIPAGRGWAYAGALLGGVVSVAANVAHSYVPPAGAGAGWVPPGGAVIGAVFWPVALFVAVEILARTAWPDSRRWITLRYVGLLPVGLVAAVVSYRHLSGLLAFYGEDGLTATIGPLAVDGLMVMATGALIATSPQRTTTERLTADTSPDSRPDIAPDGEADTVPDSGPDTNADTDLDRPADTTADPGADTGRTPARTRTRTRTRSSRRDTAAAVARLRERNPDMPVAELARRLRVSDRTVRRHLAAPTSDSNHTSNLSDPSDTEVTSPTEWNGPSDSSSFAA